MKATLRCLAVLAAIVASPHPSELLAQTNDWIDGGTTNSFSDGGNWSFGFAPDPDSFETARIGSDPGFVGPPTNPTASVAADLSGSPSPTLILGDGAGYEGTLNITSGGRLVTAAGQASTTGNLEVGNNVGVGFLNVSGTAILNVGGQLATNGGGGGASAITLSDSAVVTAGSLFFERSLRIIGPNVNFSTTGNAILGQFGTHEWEFVLTGGSANPSVLSVAGQLSLDGTLKIDTLGETPSVGDSWVIADSQSVIQAFTSVDTSDVPGLGQGINLRVVSAPGGSGNGVQTTVVVEQQPVLIVNRQSGEVSIRNPGSSASLAIDAYDVLSAAGSLSTANWASIAPNDGWQQANPEATGLSELNPLSSQSVAPSTTISLGQVFQPADMPFGQDNEDIQFKFAPEGEDSVDGLVIYEGIPTDTLTLNVDRTTGAAQIVNGYHQAVSIDTYAITSDSGSLAPSPSGWTPLGGGWQTAEDGTDAVSELNPLGILDLASNGAQALGNLFDFDAIGAEEDLVFEFSLPTEDFSRFGKVVFADALTVLPQGLQGDYNDDGVVDAADYSVWRDNLGLSDAALNGNGTGGGTVVQADYALWRSQYGSTSSVPTASPAAVAAPEPAALCFVGLVLPLLVVRRHWVG